MDSPAVASWIAQLAFWMLLACGITLGELRARGAGVFVALWAGALIGLPHVPWEPAHVMFSPFVAVLDIALVFAIFKGNVGSM